MRDASRPGFNSRQGVQSLLLVLVVIPGIGLRSRLSQVRFLARRPYLRPGGFQVRVSEARHSGSTPDEGAMTEFPNRTLWRFYKVSIVHPVRAYKPTVLQRREHHHPSSLRAGLATSFASSMGWCSSLRARTTRAIAKYRSVGEEPPREAHNLETLVRLQPLQPRSFTANEHTRKNQPVKLAVHTRFQRLAPLE